MHNFKVYLNNIKSNSEYEDVFNHFTNKILAFISVFVHKQYCHIHIKSCLLYFNCCHMKQYNIYTYFILF